MIKLSNLLSEIQINRPGNFRDNKELINYLKKNPSKKKELIDNIWKTAPWFEDPDWDYILPGWYNSDIEEYKDYQIDDEVVISNPEGDMIHVSTHPIKQNSMDEHTVNFLNTKLYWYFY